MKVKVTFEVELDDTMKKVFPPDDIALLKQNFYSYLRDGYLLYPLDRRMEYLSEYQEGRITKQERDYLVGIAEAEIAVGKVFDETIKIETEE